MTEFQRQNRPRRFQKLAYVSAALVALVLTGGGIAYAAGYDPIKLFLILHSDGSTQVFDEHGNPVDAEWKLIPLKDGTVDARVTIPNPGTYSITVTPADDQTKAKAKK